MSKKEKLIGTVSAIFREGDMVEDGEDEMMGEGFREFEHSIDLGKYTGEECCVSIKDGRFIVEVDGVYIDYPLSRVRTI